MYHSNVLSSQKVQVIKNSPMEGHGIHFNCKYSSQTKCDEYLHTKQCYNLKLVSFLLLALL